MAHLSLEVEQAQGLELDVGLGAQVSGQRAGQVLQLLDAVGDAGLQPTERNTGSEPALHNTDRREDRLPLVILNHAY